MPDSPITQRYLDRCLVDPSLRQARSHARNGPAFLEAYGSMLLPRPLFVSEAAIRGAADDACAIFDLIVSLPDRLFDGDRRRHCAAIGFNERITDIAVGRAGGPPDKYGRVDMIYDGDGFRLIEANIGSELGGIDFSEASRALLEVEAFRTFAEDNNLSYMDTCSAVAALLRRVAAPITGGRDPVIALLEWTGGFATLPALFRSMREALVARGIEVHLAEIQQLENRNDKLYFEGRPIDIALRFLDHSQAGPDPRAQELLEPVLRAHEAGGTVFFTPLESNIFTNKANLALLSDHNNRHAFAEAEGALIDRVVPWTRALTDQTTQADGEPVDLLRYCEKSRETLVVKPTGGHGGHGTVVGRDVSPEEWLKVLERSQDGHHIVQRTVAAQIERVVDPQTAQVEDWLPVWGVFFTDQGYAGEWIRARRAGGGNVVSYGTSAGLAGAFFHPAVASPAVASPAVDTPAVDTPAVES